jgi:hypothetical protein
MQAYKSKGMKAPRPGSYGLDESKAAKEAPKVKPSMQHKEPSYSKEEGMQSNAPSTKKKALPTKDAPEGAKGVNEGKSMELPKSGCPGESEV